MKASFFSFRLAAIAVLLFSFAFSPLLQAQEESRTIYFEIVKLKKLNNDFKKVGQEVITPFVQQRIKEGSQLARAEFKVLYPDSDNAEYDYVVLNVYDDFNHLNLGGTKMGEIAKKVFPNFDYSKFKKRMDASASDVGTEVFVIRDEAFPGPGGVTEETAKYVIVNSMKVSEGDSWDYAQMESEIFKPIQQAKAKEGKMHDWILLQRIMPYGSEWENNFLTMDIYKEWGDIAKGGGDYFATVHPDKNPKELWKKMSKLRELTRAETWKLTSFVNKPAPEVTYTPVKEGSGFSPKPGQEVAFNGTLRSMDGKELFSTRELGFPFHNIIGQETFDRFFDAALKQMKVGGVMDITLPVEYQDSYGKYLSGGKTAIYNVELVDIAPPIVNGAKMLKELIEEQGLAAAKAEYKKVKVNNPMAYVFREGDMNQLGYDLMSDELFDAAIYVFDLNAKNFPKSWNACDSLADGYVAAGNYPMAKECYKSALKINPDFKAAAEKLAGL